MSIAVSVFVLIACGLGVANRHLLTSTLAEVVEAATIGWMVFSIAAATVAAVRLMILFDPVIRRWSRRDIPGVAIPKPYDFAIALIAGVLGAVLFWFGVQAS